MTRRLILLGGLAATALLVGACHGRHHALLEADKPVAVAAALDCPQTVGALERVSESGDGHACAYRRGDEAVFNLAITALNGADPATALAPTEAALRTLTSQPGASQTPPAPPPAPAARTDSGEATTVDAPFVHVDTKGGSAHVKLFGVNINADDNKALVETHWGSKNATIKAGPGGAEIRVTNLDKGQADLLFILAGEGADAQGWRSVGYLARGPAAGPLLVVTFKSRASHNQNFHDTDLDRLISLNLRG